MINNQPNPAYKEIFRLKVILDEADIPNTFNHIWDGWQIRIDEISVDVVEHYFSYGHKADLLEIQGGLTEKESACDGVLGCLTAEEVFERFRYCYEHNTNIYVNENNAHEKAEMLERLFDDWDEDLN